MKNITWLITILFIFSSCQKSIETTETNKSLWPLALGNTWNYTVKSYSNFGTSFTTSAITLKVSTTSQYGGNAYFNITGLNGMYRNIDNNSIELYDGINKPSISFKNVTVDGEKITSTTSTSMYGYKATQVVNGYSCIRNTELSNGSIYRDSINYYFSPGIGLIRIEGWQINFNNNKGYYLTSNQDLNSYTIN